MKNTLLILPWVVILALLLYIGNCTHRGTCKNETVYKDSLRVDTAYRTIDNTKHYARPRPDTVYYPDSIYLFPDSAECHRIALEYYKAKIYKRHLIVDSIGWVNLEDTVFKNSLSGYIAGSHFKQIVVTKTETKTIPPLLHDKLMAGLILTGNKEYFGASPAIMFQNKKDNTIIAGYDILNKNVMMGAMVKIRLRK